MAYEVILTALADPTRRGIFEDLREKPKSVAELSQSQPISRPAVSQHLKVLREAGLVSVHRSGTRNIYAVERAGLQALRDYLDSYWTDVLTAFAEEVERKTGDKKHASTSNQKHRS